MKTIIAGSREGFTYEDILTAVEASGFKITEVVSGTCRGVDKLGERYAAENNIKVTRFYPEWRNYGLSAGPIRNKLMSEYADQAIILWDNISKGTRDMIRKARDRGLMVFILHKNKE